MAIYLGSSEKLKIVFDNISCCAHLSSLIPVANKIKLLSDDGYVLTDCNGIVLMAEGDK